MWASASVWLVLSAFQLPEHVTSADGRIALPAGRLAELIDSLPAAVEPGPVGAAWPAWSDRSTQGWGTERVWRRWVELVRSERAGSSAERRAELCVLARLQGRDEAAWEHLLACRADAGRVRALLPFFVPGVPQEWIGREGALQDGVVLSPALPPADDARSGLRALAGTKLEHRDLTIGAGRCSLLLSVDRDGLEIELEHLGGGPLRVSVLPPLPRGVERGLLFADWEKLPGHTGPVSFELSAAEPGAEESAADPSAHSLWLTFHPPEEMWPAPDLEMLRAPDRAREIVLVSPRGDEPHLRLFVESLGELLGLRARLARADFAPAPGLEPLVLRFGEGASAERKLVELFGLCEALLLAPDGR